MSQYDIVDLLHSSVNIWSNEASPILFKEKIHKTWRFHHDINTDQLTGRPCGSLALFRVALGLKGAKTRSMKRRVRTWKLGYPKRKLVTPTIHFQVRTVSFQRGEILNHLCFFGSILSISKSVQPLETQMLVSVKNCWHWRAEWNFKFCGLSWHCQTVDWCVCLLNFTE